MANDLSVMVVTGILESQVSLALIDDVSFKFLLVPDKMIDFSSNFEIASNFLRLSSLRRSIPSRCIGF